MRHLIVLEVNDDDTRDIVVAVNSDPTIIIRQVIPIGKVEPVVSDSPMKRATKVKRLSKKYRLQRESSQKHARKRWEFIKDKMAPGVIYNIGDVSITKHIGLLKKDGVTLLAHASYAPIFMNLDKLGLIKKVGFFQYMKA